LPDSLKHVIIASVENLKKGNKLMSTFKIRLSNPVSHQTGSMTVKAWDQTIAVEEAKSKLQSLGFTKVLSCEVV
jgi:hypothetical protein